MLSLRARDKGPVVQEWLIPILSLALQLEERRPADPGSDERDLWPNTVENLLACGLDDSFGQFDRAFRA